ncbi:GlcG/HbpS family heme-binding protein [Methyloraptor flagellatus]|uniref:Heme-binding protein n=1 Tax=Methyloraptor flagellatus TaxID=3162530 RepID=A0AAU7XE79_9HYPH
MINLSTTSSSTVAAPQSRRRSIRRLWRGPAVAAATALLLGLLDQAAEAQVRRSGYDLPATLAVEAASEAVRVCAERGYPVSAAVVDPSGEIKAFVKGDHSTVHTKTSSFRKAYTVVTLGPVFGFEALGAFVEKTRGGPNTAALASLPDVLLLAGGVAIRAKGETIAAIGVGGAPGGEKDEVCAAAGAAKIGDRLPQ